MHAVDIKGNKWVTPDMAYLAEDWVLAMMSV